jgi:putative ABC transport system substrate-binding protein
MKRREFIGLIGGAVVTRPLGARAQAQRAVPVVGVLGSSSPESVGDRLVSLQQGLGDAGYVEGGNVALDFRWAYDQYDRLPGLATATSSPSRSR